MGFVFTVIYNIVTVGIFAKLAMHFGKWWIILFALLVTASYQVKKPTEKDFAESDQSDGGIEE